MCKQNTHKYPWHALKHRLRDVRRPINVPKRDLKPILGHLRYISVTKVFRPQSDSQLSPYLTIFDLLVLLRFLELLRLLDLLKLLGVLGLLGLLEV